MSTPEWATYLSETVGIPGTADEVADAFEVMPKLTEAAKAYFTAKG